MDRGTFEGGSLRIPPVAETETKLSFVVMSCAEEAYAVEIGRVREIIRLPKITWVPGAKSPVRGLINLRGAIVTVLDLAEFLSGTSLEPDEGARIVIVEAGAIVAGLMVESAASVTEISTSTLSPPMTTLDETHRKFIVAQAEIENRLVGILNIDALLLRAQELQSPS